MRNPTSQPHPLLGAIFLLSALVILIPLSRASPSPPPLFYSEAEREIAVPSENYSRLTLEIPILDDYFRLFQARADLPQGEAVRTLQELIAERPKSPVAFEAHFSLAKHFSALNDARAESEYRTTLELEDTAAVRLELAYYLEDQGRDGEAYAEYKVLLDTGSFPEAFIGMRRLATDDLTLAQDLVEATYFSDALEVIGETTDPTAIPLRAAAHFGLGEYEEAESFYEEWLGIDPENEEARFGRAQTLGRLGEYDEALKIYRGIDSAASLFAQGELLELVGDSEAALAIYQRLFDLGLYPVAWWRAAGILEDEGRPEEALDYYLAVTQSQTNLADDAAYRMFVLAGRLGDEEMESQALSLLQGMMPNYLALLATGEQLAPAVSSDFPPAGRAILEKAAALRYLGLYDYARRELVYAARFGDSPAVIVSMAQTLYAQGDVLDAHRLADDLLQEQESVPLAVWRLAYPKPYLAEVEAAAEEFDLDPLLLYAMMRAESRYDPEAVSPSYAQGLLQIIPSTRDDIAESLGLDLTPTDIFDPEINIRLGAYYLRFALDTFGADPEYALAAYNGGPGNVQNWQDDPRVGDKDDFLRFIGSAQTREYVSIVLLSYRVYQWLEGQQATGDG